MLILVWFERFFLPLHKLHDIVVLNQATGVDSQGQLQANGLRSWIRRWIKIQGVHNAGYQTMHIVLLLGSLTFLVNSMGRFPTNTVLASLSGFSSASLDFFFLFLAFFISSSSSSSLKTSNGIWGLISAHNWKMRNKIVVRRYLHRGSFFLV